MTCNLEKRLLAVAIAWGLFLVASSVRAQTVLWSENFDSLTLEPNVDEGVPDATAFTHDPPSGWTITNGDELEAATGGVEEWRGWSFADPTFWAAVEDQRRSEFSKGQNVIAVAESDEYADIAQEPPVNNYATFLTTAPISLAESNSNVLALQFDSSWRPETQQKATITASFGGGPEVEILRFESATTSPFFKDDNSTNDSLTVFFDKPTGATDVQFEFGYFDASNNWWWAIDNLQLLDGDPALRAVVDRGTGEITLFNRTGQDQDIKGYSIESAAGALDPTDWNSIAGNLDVDGDGTVDSDDRWIRLTDPDSNTDISEASLGTGTLAANSSLELGPTWLKYFQDEEDLRFRYIDGDGNVVEGILQVTGNEGNSFMFADLDFDNDIDAQDWQTFVAGVGSDVAGATQAVQYHNADLNGDGRHSPADLILFRNAYNGFNGNGAFAAVAGAPIPEPGTAVLVGLTLVMLLLSRIRSPQQSMRPLVQASALLVGLALALGGAIPAGAQPVIPILFEDFEGLPLKDATSPTETPAAAVWTDVPPAGWVRDNSTTPAGPPEEFFGWTFANKDWWINTAGDQDRSRFTRGQGTVAVADPDEYDDGTNVDDELYNVFLSTPAIDLAGIPVGAAVLSFDSSWRNEVTMDAMVEVSFNGGTTYETVLMYDSSDPIFSDEFIFVNEHVRIDLDNPDTGSLIVRWGMVEASNDWWWAIDNVTIGFEAEPLTLEVNTTSGEMQILASTTQGANFNISSYSVTSPSGSLNPGSDGGGGPVDGDYNDNGQVEQADLDLVLLNWGEGVAALPGDWTNQRPTEGIVDQAELDGVLLNWGNMGGGGGGGEGWLAGNLAARDVDSIGDGLGESWEVLTASENQLFEAFLLGSTLFDGGRAESIGEAFQVGGDQDLEFLFSTVGGNEIQGNVVYVAGASLTGKPIPEPSGLILIGLAALVAGVPIYLRKRPMTPVRNLAAMGTLAMTITWAASAHADGLLIRHYPFEDGSAGQGLNTAEDVVSFGPENEDLFGSNTSYASLSGGRTGLGASFNGSSSYLEGPALNDPVDSPSSAALNLTGIADRGFQLWAFPRVSGAGSRQDVVMDTTQHGVYISPEDTWGFVFAGEEHDTGVPVNFDAWTHVQLASFNSSGLATLYLDGEAVAATSGRYNTDLDISPSSGWTLEVGSNSGVLSTLDPFPGSENFYDGIVDDLKFSVYGSNGDLDHPFDFAVDNDAAAAALQGIDPADVNMDGQVTGNGTGPAVSDDVTAFVEGWMSRNVLSNGLLAGDLSSRASGDLNFDGVTDIADWAVLNLADPAAGASALTAISSAGVPEPSTLTVSVVCLILWAAARRRRACA